MLPYYVFDRITLGPITIYTWGLLTGLGFLAGWLFACDQAKKEKIKITQITNLALGIIGGALVGSRLLFVIENYSLYLNDWLNIFKIWQGGFSYYGGFGGGILATLIYVKKAKLNLKKILDILALSLPLGLAIGRLGCFLINDHLGAKTYLPWAIKHPDGTLRHPVALYLSLAGLLLFIFLLIIRSEEKMRIYYHFPRTRISNSFIIKKRVKTEGLLTCFFFIGHGLLRFLLDFTRSREEFLAYTDNHYFGFTLAQFFSIGMFLAGLWLLMKWRKS